MVEAIYGSIRSLIKRTSYEQFEWKLEKFSSILETSGYCTSPRIIFSDNEWFILLNLKTDKGKFCALFLQSTNFAAPMLIHFLFGVKKEDGCIEQLFSSNFLFDSNVHWGTLGAIPETDFLKRKTELVPSDCLSIILVMSKKIPQLIKYGLDLSIQLTADDKEYTPDMIGIKQVSSDMRKLFLSGDNNDVVICVKDIELKAHSVILAARIPAMSAMFQHDTLEKASNRINITDCEPSIFKEFLHYIYSGTIRNFSADNMYDLYRVADKYLVNDLKILCRNYMHDNLRVETFCDTIKLALIYEDEDLLRPAIDYFAEHFRLIIKRVEWLNYLKENPIKVNEIFIKSFCPS